MGREAVLLVVAAVVFAWLFVVLEMRNDWKVSKALAAKVNAEVYDSACRPEVSP